MFKQSYIPPTSPYWKVPYFCESPSFIIKRDGHMNKITKEQMKQPLEDSNSGIRLINGMPLLVTIYCGNVIYPIRVLTKVDSKINKMRNSASNKYEALLLARFKNEDTREFEKRYFTTTMLKNFDNDVISGFNKFKQEIYEKAVLRNWVCFPDKIYNTIRLGDIIDSNLSIEDKQKKACDLIKECTKGWKKDALFEFYKNYCS